MEMSFIQKLRLLSEWAPLLSHMQQVMASDDPHQQAVAIIDALQFAAGKSSTEIDDEALDHLEAVLKSDEGKAFFAWVVGKVKGAA